ncbi:hypothetical protein ACJ73_07930 [Blastomyces percursus]|uniref:Uncharacterized protein n=1 Tax=Blastomyces percursus TaxID=1658174 RepID=A0A1J9QZJ2_9EURO|nr:hypothetical protein ACJ73_07930 [Blastomyces percursus]
MCNGFSSRTSQGGATAFLRPLITEADETASNNTPFDYQITLREHHTAEREAIHFYINRPTGEQADTTRQIQRCPVEAFRTYWVEIQSRQDRTRGRLDNLRHHPNINIRLPPSPDGDLTPSEFRDAIPPLHRFPLQNLTQPEDLETSPTALACMKLITGQRKMGGNSTVRKLRLDACEMGVIGRRMSIVNATGVRVAEGVIGWN